MAKQAFDPGTINAEESHSCGPFHPCGGRGVLTVAQVITAIELASDGGEVNGAHLRKLLGLPDHGIPVIGVHIGPFGQPIDLNSAA